MRIAVVTPVPTPYRDPFWSEVAAAPGIDLTVFYCSGGMDDHPWTEGWSRKFKAQVLPGGNLLRWRGPDAACFWNPAIRRRLAEGRCDALLIGGYNHLTMWAAMFYAVNNRIPFFLMSESHERFRRARWKQWAKQPMMRWIVRHAAGFLPSGKLAAEYLVNYGASRHTMIPLPNVPNVADLQEQTARLRQFGGFPGPAEFAGRPIVLFVGRLIAKKRAALVIRAFHESCASHDAILAIVGDGELRGQLESLVDNLGIRSRVHFAGFVQPQQVLRWYACASVFVLPSSETFGAAVVEALAAGVPVIVSDEVGAGVDVVTNETVGTIIPARDQAALVRAIQDRLRLPVSPVAVDRAWDEVRRQMSYPMLARKLTDGLHRLSAAGKASNGQLPN